MLTMALASLFLPFLPLTPVQILLNNMLYDLSQTGIAFDRAEGGDLATRVDGTCAASFTSPSSWGPCRHCSTSRPLRHSSPLWRQRPHRLLVMSASLCLGTAIALPFLPFAPTLGFSAPPPGILMVTAALVAAYLLCAEALKRVAMR